MPVSGRMEVVGSLPGGGSAGELLGVVTADNAAEPLPVRLVPVPDRVAGDPGLLAQLRRDAAAAAELLHPNILRVFGIEDVQGTAMQVLALVEAHSLRAIVETGGRLPPQITARILVDACAAVQFAHDNGRGGHRLQGDLCLDTVLVTDSGATLVAGLGGPPLSRPSRDRLHLLSPEQIVAGPGASSPETDVYLLGLLLHACLAGEPPFAEEPDPEAAVLTKPPPPLAALGIAEPLADVVARALAKTPQDRFRSPGALADEISRAAGELAEPAAVAFYIELLFPPEDQDCAARRAATEAALAARRVAPSLPGPPEQISPPAQPPSASSGPAVSSDSAASEATPPGAPAEPALPELDLITTTDIVLETEGPPAPPDLAGTTDIVLETEGPPAPPDLAGTADIVIEAEKLPAPPDLAGTADIVIETESPHPAPDLVSTADIVGEGSSAKILPADMVSTADIVGEGSSPVIQSRPSSPVIQPRPALSLEARPRRRGVSYAGGAAIAVASMALGFYLSRLGAPEPSTSGDTSSTPAAGTEPRPISEHPAPVPALPPVPAAAEIPHDTAPLPESPPPPRAAPPPADSKARPSLHVSADPPGSIYVDGKLVGRSPLVRPVSRGTHKVRLYDAASGVDVTRTVNVRGPGQRVRIALGKGTVTITAPEGASILIDGRKVATTEVRDLPLWEGNHRLVVTLGPARHATAFQLGAGESYTYEVSRAASP